VARESKTMININRMFSPWVLSCWNLEMELI